MALTYRELRKLSDEEVEELHDRHHDRVEVGMQWYRDELHRRQIERQSRTLVRLTIAITILTLVNVVLVALTLFE